MKDLPILDVHVNNSVAVWPSMKYGIDTAEFVAVDLELSGLGNRKKLASKCLDERYQEIGNAARSRSIISLGISCFRRETSMADCSDEAEGFVVQTYNILALCSQPYIVEPEALKFLTQHGFDFNKQYEMGLPYNKPASGLQTSDECSLNHLFLMLSASNKPLILHNGLVDLIFLYQNLYLELPSKLSTFLADIEHLFSAGIYDTKYLAEYHVRLKASYLQYVFRSCMKWNAEHKDTVKLEFIQSQTQSQDVYCVALTEEQLSTDVPEPSRVCQQFAFHGWCPKAMSCKDSHNVSLIVNCDRLHRTALKNRKRRLKQKERRKRLKVEQEVDNDEGGNELDTSCEDLPNLFLEGSKDDNKLTSDDNKLTSDTESSKQLVVDSSSAHSAHSRAVHNCHRAGVDAFMTGLSYAVFTLQLENKNTNLKELGNKLYLSGKNLPLQVTKGNFGKISQAHSDRSSVCTAE